MSKSSTQRDSAWLVKFVLKHAHIKYTLLISNLYGEFEHLLAWLEAWSMTQQVVKVQGVPFIFKDEKYVNKSSSSVHFLLFLENQVC